jgi:hypothetical protein
MVISFAELLNRVRFGKGRKSKGKNEGCEGGSVHAGWWLVARWLEEAAKTGGSDERGLCT